MRALKAGSAQRVYVARDIDTFLYQKVTAPARMRACRFAAWMKRRRSVRRAGLDIPCAAAAILK